MSRAVTIRDVARAANVSISTVSRVLNSPSMVKEEKRAKVEEAIRTLGFSPNQMARGLLKKETGGLGVILPYVGGEFFSELLTSVDKAAQEQGMFLMISTSHRNTEAMKTVLKNMRSRVDGVMIMASDGTPEMLKSIVNGTSPIVFINTNTSDIDGLETVNFDNFSGAYMATEHLIKLNHKRIAMLKGPEFSFDASERLRGYRRALMDHGIELNHEMEIPGDFTPEAGYLAARSILDINPRPTAIFGANDQSTIALMSVLRNLDVSIPGDISVVGFDDIPAARYAAPPLTSIKVPIWEIGETAIQRLIHLIREKDSPKEHHTHPVVLIERESTAYCS